jgi:hypothetical protein
MMRVSAGAAAALELVGAAATVTASSPPPARAVRNVTLTGTRTVVVTGKVRYGPAAGTYAVRETDRGLEVRSILYVLAGATPASGIEPFTETVHASVGLDAAGVPTVASTIDTTTGFDRGAGQPYPVDDVRIVTTTYRGPVAAIEHVVENGTGSNGTGFASVDFTRTTNADGSFDEEGSLSTFETHSVHVRPDFTASSHDHTPGFGLRDVLVAAPAGMEAGATIAVTVSMQGRTVGYAPVVVQTYTTLRWFSVDTPPTVASRVATRNAATNPDCGFPPGTTSALEVRGERRQIDPTGTTTDVVQDVFYDASVAPLCRIEQSTVTYMDVTTGTATATRSDRTVVTTSANATRP